MQWGFGWELGPFEILDAIGPHETLGGVFPPGRTRFSRRWRALRLVPTC